MRAVAEEPDRPTASRADGEKSDGRRRQVHFKRRVQLWGWYRVPRWIRRQLGRLSFGMCEIFFHLAGCRGATNGVQRILVIRLDHVGDVLMTTPALRALRRRYPHAEITGVVGSWACPVLAANPCVDRVIPYDAVWFDRRAHGATNLWRRALTRWTLIRLRADLAVNFRGDYGNVLFTYLTGARFRLAHIDAPEEGERCPFWLTHPVSYPAHVHETDRCLDLVKAVSATVDTLSLDFFLRPEVELEGQRVLEDLDLGSADRVVALHPGGGWPLNWWPAERYARLGDWLCNQEGTAVLFVGGPEERKLVERIRGMMRRRAASVCGETSLELLAAILKRVSLFVGNDGGVMHMAEATQVPLVALFGCSPVEEFGPRSSRAWIVRGPVPCPPCPQFEWGVSSHCPERPCMSGITLEEVQEAVTSALRNPDMKADMTWGAPMVCAIGEAAGEGEDSRGTSGSEPG